MAIWKSGAVCLLSVGGLACQPRQQATSLSIQGPADEPLARRIARSAIIEALEREYGPGHVADIPLGNDRWWSVWENPDDRTHWFVSWQSPAWGDYYGFVLVRKDTGQVSRVAIPTRAEKDDVLKRAAEFLARHNMSWGQPVTVQMGADPQLNVRYHLEYATSKLEIALGGRRVLDVPRDGGPVWVPPRR